MATPIEALTALVRKINFCSKSKPELDIVGQDVFKVACAVVDFNEWLGRPIVMLGDAGKKGHVVEVLAADKFLCVFGTEKMELRANQFCWYNVEAKDPERREPQPAPIPMLLHCPSCGERHIDSNGWETKIHTTHACQHCGFVWRPALVATVGVQFLPGYKNNGPT